MREKHYSSKTIRMAEETWDEMKKERLKSNKSWNLFIVLLLRTLKLYGTRKSKQKGN